MTETIRTQVLDAIEAWFVAMNEVEPVGDPYGYQFSVVSRDPLGQIAKGKKAVLGVYGGTAERKPRYPFSDVDLEIVLEVHVAKEANTAMTKTVERILGAIERRLKDGGTYGGLIADVIVTGDQVTVDGQYDNESEGALFAAVRYSQREDDPRMGRG